MINLGKLNNAEFLSELNLRSNGTIGGTMILINGLVKFLQYPRRLRILKLKNGFITPASERAVRRATRIVLKMSQESLDPA
jgi:hypothetical protein